MGLVVVDTIINIYGRASRFRSRPYPHSAGIRVGPKACARWRNRSLCTLPVEVFDNFQDTAVLSAFNLASRLPQCSMRSALMTAAPALRVTRAGGADPAVMICAGVAKARLSAAGASASRPMTTARCIGTRRRGARSAGRRAGELATALCELSPRPSPVVVDHRHPIRIDLGRATQVPDRRQRC